MQITKGSFKDAAIANSKVPEFDKFLTKEEYKKRIGNKKHLILIAKEKDEIIGFKVGYERDNDNSFYTWMGGVVPEQRKNNVATKLAKAQEKWAKENGYNKIKLKTRNRYSHMIIFAIKNNFKIMQTIQKDSIIDYRILLEKELK